MVIYIMNYKIKKIDNNNEEVIEFLNSENFKMFTELNQSYLSKHPNSIEDEKYRGYELLINSIKDAKVIYAAYLDNRIIGAGFINNDGYLDSLFVEEKYRNQGIGTNLLKKMIVAFGIFKLIKVDARIDAISLYEKFSFKIAGTDDYNAFVPMERNGSRAK